MSWRLVEGLFIAAVVVLGGTTAVLGASWLLSRLARRYGTDDVPLRPPVARFPKLPAPEVDALQIRAKARRARAEARHAEGRAMETGDASRSFTIVGGRR